MSAVNRIRLGLLLAAGLMTTGCGRGAPAPLDSTRSQAPRRIELPADIRPLIPERAAENVVADAGSIRVEYQQPQSPTTSRPPFNVELVATPQPSGASPVREPLSAPPPAVNDAPATPPKRSQFIPISMPQSSTAPEMSQAPTMPPSASFVAAAPASNGPQFSATVNSASPSPVAGQFKTPAEPQPDLPQPRPERWTSAPVAPAALPASRDRQVASAPSNPEPIVSVYHSPVVPEQAITAIALQAVGERAMQMADHASATAQRGMYFSARTELLQALQLIAQALDVHEGSANHAGALAAGLTALEEARDFSIVSNRPSNAVSAGVIAANHRTPLIRNAGSTLISPVIAQQQYFGYAQSQFVLATGGVPAASQILYRLGRLQTAMAVHDADPLALHAAQSIVFHQAALATDRSNWLAANELGVLYARFGQLAQARQLLVYSVNVHPHIEGWHNLAAVHRRLGESDLAERAEAEREFLVQKAAKSGENMSNLVRWVDAKTFAGTGGRDVQGPADQRYAVTPAASTVPARR